MPWPTPREREDGLQDDGAAEQRGELEAAEGDDGDQGVPQGVPENHDPLSESLAAGGAHVVLAQHLQQVGAGDAGEIGAVAPGQDQGGPHDLEDVVEGVIPDGGVVEGRGPVEVDEHHEDKDEGDPEVGEGVAGHGQDAHQVVLPSVLVEGRDDAQGYGDEDADEEGVDGELERHREAAREDLRNGLVVQHGLAPELAVDHAPDPAGVLDGQGIVEAELLPQALQLLESGGVRLLAAEDEESDVPGEDAHDGEDGQGGEEQGGEEEEHPPCEILVHGRSS